MTGLCEYFRSLGREGKRARQESRLPGKWRRRVAKGLGGLIVGMILVILIVYSEWEEKLPIASAE